MDGLPQIFEPTLGLPRADPSGLDRSDVHADT